MINRTDGSMYAQLFSNFQAKSMNTYKYPKVASLERQFILTTASCSSFMLNTF